VDHWYVATLPGPRGATGANLRDELMYAGIEADRISVHEHIGEAFAAAREATGPDDRIVVFGSFLTVGAVLPIARSPHHR